MNVLTFWVQKQIAKFKSLLKKINYKIGLHKSRTLTQSQTETLPLKFNEPIDIASASSVTLGQINPNPNTQIHTNAPKTKSI